MIRVSHLRKTYGRLVAVDDVSFEVSAGALFAFLGANGAGKSTTIGCITTTVGLTSGTVEVAGLDVTSEAHQVRQRIGAVFQSSLLDPLLTVEENLAVRAGFYGLDRRATKDRIGKLTKLIGLEGIRTRRYGLLSGGQKRRADIARALVHRPSVLFLDEPTAGLDPQSREQIWAAIEGLRTEDGTTVFLTTHYMEETERADQVCIIDRGQIVAEGTPGALRARYSKSTLTVRSQNTEETARAAREQGLEVDVNQGTGQLTLFVDSAAQALEFLRAHAVDDFEFRHGTMDDVFLTVTREIAA